ncbi:predicted protein [Plenodomus lingam JN3]|uniref:Predicted protein n=1 Tax=Leptosphaeria maculans (strain JN3 / isolate v23.1.3 / race Av1-4-5-6-7-8) TaxID=985895 RepID=E5A2L0_LEPMJ|nr:predicted protein [Plenodomus lingam JN3]CBX97806.1 predicted protein [Plenodomus lingam JN3]
MDVVSRWSVVGATGRDVECKTDTWGLGWHRERGQDDDGSPVQATSPLQPLRNRKMPPCIGRLPAIGSIYNSPEGHGMDGFPYQEDPVHLKNTQEKTPLTPRLKN